MKPSPEALYGELYTAVQFGEVFEDGKYFSDATSKFEPRIIIENYEKYKDQPGFDLKQFILAHFKMPTSASSGFESNLEDSVSEHIEKLWPVLRRDSDQEVAHQWSSLIPLPFPYIVPGGRFNEIYYWDSYFTMLGLKVSKHYDIIQNMIQNFAWMIDQIGFIPNGNRSYFLGRSQPPFFGMMLELLESVVGFEQIKSFLPQLHKEYDFWMSGGRVVQLDDGILNRYWDENTTARGEMLGDDLHLLEKASRESGEFFRDIRAACESGWDFSSRWLDDSNELTTIQASKILPIDLNALLYKTETLLAKWNAALGNLDLEKQFSTAANIRKQLMQKYFWNEQEGFFYDYNLDTKSSTGKLSLAAAFPLFVEYATIEQSQQVAKQLESVFLKDGGFVTTPLQSGQQWDSPNGWAPLQWVCFKGLRNYQQYQLANEGRERWLNLNETVFKNTGKMLEKYNVEDIHLETGGGEYPVQDGFGWTNGVYLAMKSFDEKLF